MARLLFVNFVVCRLSVRITDDIVAKRSVVEKNINCRNS